MKTELPLAHLSRWSLLGAGAPAFEGGVQLLPGRVEKVTVAHRKVVRVHG